MICQLPDRNTEMIIHQKVVHLLELFNHISHTQPMDNNIKVEPMNHQGVNHFTHYGKLIATTPYVCGLFFVD